MKRITNTKWSDGVYSEKQKARKPSRWRKDDSQEAKERS